MSNTLLTANISAETVTEKVTAKTATTNDIILYLILALTVVFFTLLIILIYQNKQSSQLWNGKGSNRGKVKLSDRIFPSVYQFLRTFPFTKNYIEKLSYRYRLISPCDSKFIARKTVSACLISWGISIITFIAVFLMNPRLITLIIVVFAILLVNSEVVGRMAQIFEITVFSETQKMIANVEHYFYVDYRVDDALYRSRDSLSPNMKTVADQIYQLLLSDDKDEALREYYENIPNKYLRAFVSQCVGEMERGNQKVDGKLLFIRNMENLQRELDIEIDKLQRLSMEFLGVIGCVVAPVFCIDFVKKFAISIKENMETFYYGKEGFLIDIGLLITITCIYLIMRKSAEYAVFHKSSHKWLYTIDRLPLIKKAMDNYCDKNASKMERLKRDLRNNGNNIRPRHFILRSFLLAGLVLVLGIGITGYLHGLSKNQLLVAEPADVEMLTSAAKESQYEDMGKSIETYTQKYVIKSETVPASSEEMIKVLERDGTFNNKIINAALADEILQRVSKYKIEYFSFLDLFVCILLSTMAYLMPKIMMKYSAAVSRDAMEDEVNQFIALICMLMFIDSMTVKQILVELESFAVVFKQSLLICINDYGSGDMKALTDLKEREPYEHFNRIVDNLIRCDSMPIYQAFHEVDVERDGYMAKRKLANEKSIRKRVFRAYMLAAIPFILLFAYGLVPTLLASMNEINSMIKELESTSW